MTTGNERRQNDLNEGKARWYHPWKERRTLAELLISVALLVGAMVLYSTYLIYNESRPGAALDDPLLDLLPVADVATIVFAIIYGAVILAIYSLLKHPRRLLLALQTYTLLVLVRIVALYLTPLDPPAAMIPLYDPMAGLGPGDLLYRDLFFSGHTSTLFLLFLTARKGMVRWIFLLCTIAVGTLVLVQHCHYSIDVFAAPFFAYGCYRVIVKVRGGVRWGVSS